VNRLTLFGGVALGAESGPITGRAAQRHRVALLALLSTTRRLYRSRDQLITFLWPDANAERGRKLLSDSIYRINQALGGDAVIGSGEDVRLNRWQLGTDVADLEAAMDERDWARVAKLYAGPFLDGFFLPGAPDFDQWMETERTRYVRAADKAIDALAVAARDAGRDADALDWRQRQSALMPDDSRVAVELMRALEASGNCAGALRHARVHSHFLRAHFGVEPDPSVQRLAEQIARRSAETGNAPLADGVSEELTWILEGSVRRSGNVLRFAAQLTDTSNGNQVWSDSFDRASSDADWTPADVASAIVSRLALAQLDSFARETRRQMSFHVRPLGEQNAVHHRVPNGPIAPRLVVPDHAVEMRTERRDRPLRREVEIVGPQSDDLAPQRLERVR
jgi:DNA-binding SARP family transcriptional activator